MPSNGTAASPNAELSICLQKFVDTFFFFLNFIFKNHLKRRAKVPDLLFLKLGTRIFFFKRSEDCWGWMTVCFHFLREIRSSALTSDSLTSKLHPDL